jgi:NAD(P)-dependent dehydrogenase (short-subunit alcohol dehydrogenase family)
MPARGGGRTPVALVTGGNRGIGLEVCRQLADRGYDVVLGSRDEAKGQAAARGIAGANGSAVVSQLDVSDPESVERARELVASRFGRLDALVNNAAALYDTWQNAVTADLEQVHAALESNTLGPWRLVLGAGTPAYRVSRTALHALTRMLAAELRRDRILVNAVCPGWVATDMGGPGGRPVAKGAASVVWAVVLPDDGPTGGFFRDGRRLDW